MLASMETYLRQGQRQLRRVLLDPRLQRGAVLLAWGGSGFFLSAASLYGSVQPLAMGLACAAAGWQALAVLLGAVLGYWIFWGRAGFLGMAFAGAGAVLAWTLGSRKEAEELPLLLPGAAAAGAGILGLVFLVWGWARAPLGVWVLRTVLAGAGAWFFRRLLHSRDAVFQWVAGGVAVLALAQVVPVPWLGLGYAAAAVFAMSGTFPAAALAGLGLDLAQVTPVPMSPVLCTAYFLRLLPFRDRWMRYASPAVACLGVMGLCGVWDGMPLPGLILGSAAAYLLPPRPEGIHRRGETGVAQVRLELCAGVMTNLQQLLLEVPPRPIDQEALICKVQQRACADCSARNSCRDREKLTVQVLQHPLEFSCRKTGRVLGELRRSQDQLRQMKADRDRQQEYRWALVQQYRFLAEYLRELSDQLPRRGERLRASYRLEAAVRSAGKERANGDRCLAFAGTGCRYYVLLCDGMGTGLGAAQEGQSAGSLLQRMLTAGLPPEYALRTVNSHLALAGQAGAVTVDLAEIRLDSGRISLYKWGAAPSWLLGPKGAEKIGTATPPPGISVRDGRETVVRLSLRRGETLILVSDGVDGEVVQRRKEGAPDAPPGELAEWLLENGCKRGEDDASVAVLRLRPRQLAP